MAADGPVAYCLRGAHVLDAVGEFTTPLDLAIVDGRIARLGPRLPADLASTDLDAGGLWLLPGIVDAHLHAATHTDDLGAALRTAPGYRTAETLHVLRRTLHSGVTLVRDAGGLDAGIRDAVAAGLAESPQLQVSVVPLSQTGGHGDGFLAAAGVELPVEAMTPEWPGRPPHTADGVDGVRRWVRQVLRAGADWIKVFATGGVLSGSAEDGFGQELTDEELAVAGAEAARRGAGLMVHALGGPAIAAAVRAGARSIEHGIFLTEADAALMAAHDVTLVPTLSIYAELVDRARAGLLPPAAARRALAVGRVLGENVRIARAAGVRIALGSDIAHRDSHGHALREITALAAAGMTFPEALLAATAEGAQLCGVAADTGVLRPGARFDAVVLDEEPANAKVFTDPATVTGVFLGGRAVRPHHRWPLGPDPLNPATTSGDNR